MITRDPKEIEILRQGGKILASALKKAAAAAKPGISAFELDQIAEKEIRNMGGIPSFKNYRPDSKTPPFPGSLCVSVNEEIVHGVPDESKMLKAGDIVGLDLGVEYRGLFTDAAITVGVGELDENLSKLTSVAKQCLDRAIENVKPGNFISDISWTIQKTAESNGFSVVRELVGHGVGKAIHEDPEIPCFGKPKTGIKIVEGMVLAIEPMVNMGGWKVKFDGPWSVKTEDGSKSAHFEHTVLVTAKGCEILTNVV
ncbi:MAG: type I methionyl aminopeptidase [Candidatus Doudnabacteria bacterium]|nr:type I methionyl aminopeptidase [Candidatus Doudnabacteria bacterium]